MSEPAVPFLRPYTPEQMQSALRERLGVLRAELDAEMAARARAEAEADEARELARDLQTRIAWAEADRARLLRVMGWLLLGGAAPFVLAGLAAGFAAVLLLRWAGW